MIKNSGEYFVGYWKNDNRHGRGAEYNKEGDMINSGEYKNGVLIEEKK